MKAARVFLAFLVARAAYGLMYLAVSAGRLPTLLYYPLSHRFVWSTPAAAPHGLAMAWFGSTALALVAAALLGSVAWLASGRGPLARALARPRILLGIAHAGALILLVDFVYFGFTMTHQTPAPLPLPR